MKIDLHTHSIASGHAINTIDELIDYASKLGLTHLGITEHGPSMEGAPHEGYFWISDKIPQLIKGVNVYLGIEANILNKEGDIDLSQDILKTQRIVSAGLHKKTPYINNTKSNNTEAIINTIKSGLCAIITHPLRDDFQVYIEPIVEAALNNNVLLELNNQTFSDISENTLKEYTKMIRLIKEKGGYVILGSDSHINFTLGNFDNILNHSSKIGLDDKIIINNYPGKIKEYLR